MLTPETEIEVAEILRSARGALAVRGGGTRALGQPVGEILSTRAMTGITLYEPGALTIVAKAGTPLAEVEATLAAEGQMLPFEPPYIGPILGREGQSTIGGVVAANASGSRRIQAGACRDSLIGVRFVDGRGDVVTNGGRVMKNVTGYDLVKLLAGSHGTLGVVSEVSFKVLPAPVCTGVLRFEGHTLADGIDAMTRALGSPYEVSGAAYVPEERATLLRLEGLETAVAYRLRALTALLQDLGVPEIQELKRGADTPFQAVRNATIFKGGAENLWRISIKPSDAFAVASALPEGRLMFDWGGGLIWAETSDGLDVRAALRGISGYATLVRAAAETIARLGVFAPEPAPVAALSSGIRAQFDPKGLLNRGLMETL